MLPGRTTDSQVRAILLSDVDPTVTDLSPWIDFANEIVTTVCGAEPSYTTYRLEQIERCLAAHFYCVSDPRTRSEGVSGVSASYEGDRKSVV